MEKEYEYCWKVRQRFKHLNKKKILIYGTGIIAKRLIESLRDYQITGVVDRLHFGGEFAGVPILLWDEIRAKDVDAVIIAASKKNYGDIYQRIVDKCMTYGISVYGENGIDLIGHYGWNPFNVGNARYYQRRGKELEELIAQYDAISFDLFDTLIMRKTLEPTDVFDIVEDRARQKGTALPQFKVWRREAELQAGCVSIYKIYDILGEMLGLTEEQKKLILEIELSCEKDVLVPRKEMVELVGFAKSLGKKVSIISDMYLDAEILNRLLEGMHIRQYDKIYVSCDYGVSKGNGLFEIYLKDVQGMRCLHIGDNMIADVQEPLKYGIASYGIKSAYDMIKISNFRYILSWVNNCNEKNLLGLLISDLFNSPFALYGSAGIVHIENLKILGKAFTAPLSVIYILNLISWLQKNPGYKKIIFSARDGFLFKKLYDLVRRKYEREKNLPESVYLLTSRKLCFRAVMGKNFEVLAKSICGKMPEKVLIDILGIPEDKVCQYDKNRYTDEMSYYMEHMDIIREKSEVTRERYMLYLKNRKLELSDKYLFCELVSQGTVQFALNQIFQEPLDGFYVCKCVTDNPYPVNIESIYQNSDKHDILMDKHYLLERIFTSPEPSVEDMNENDIPEFSMEIREKEDIERILSIQQGIEDFFEDYYGNLWVEDKEIKKELPERLLGMCNEVEYAGECAGFNNVKLFDDLGGEYFKVLRGC